MALLSDIADILGGFAFKSSDLGPTGIPVVKIADIRPPTVSLDACDRVAPEKTAGLDRFLLKNRDIVMAMTGATTGKVGRLRSDTPAYLNQRVAKLSAKAGNEFNDYLYALVSQPGFDQKVLQNAAGSAQPNVSAHGIGRIELPDLSRPEQLRVGRIVAELDDKIELNRKMSATLEAMARALFKSWFVDFDPVHAKAEGRDPGLPAEIATLFPNSFEGSEVGNIPKGWTVSLVSDIADVERGLSYKGEFLGDGGLPMINLGCFVGGGAFDDSKIKSYRGPYRQRHIVANGDLVMANTDITQARKVLGSPGLVFSASPTEKYLFSHHTYAFRFHSDALDLRNYLYFMFLEETFRERATGFATGTTVLALPRDAILDYRFARPCLHLIGAFNDVVRSMLCRKENARRESLALAAIRDSLLPKLIAGEIRLADAERIVGKSA